MPTKPKATLQKTTSLKSFEKDAEFRSLYINNVAFGFSRFDFQMTLGLVEISQDARSNNVRELAAVKMTHGYAKAFLSDMKVVIDAFEAVYGEIEIPKQLK